MRIQCPQCGPRDELEFTWGGEAHITRPDPAQVTDAQWADYLVMRANPAGAFHERWCHTYGCGLWFNVERDTVTHRIARAYPIDVGPADPVIPAQAGIQVGPRLRGDDEK